MCVCVTCAHLLVMTKKIVFLFQHLSIATVSVKCEINKKELLFHSYLLWNHGNLIILFIFVGFATFPLIMSIYD